MNLRGGSVQQVDKEACISIGVGFVVPLYAVHAKSEFLAGVSTALFGSNLFHFFLLAPLVLMGFIFSANAVIACFCYDYRFNYDMIPLCYFASRSYDLACFFWGVVAGSLYRSSTEGAVDLSMAFGLLLPSLYVVLSRAIVKSIHENRPIWLFTMMRFYKNDHDSIGSFLQNGLLGIWGINVSLTLVWVIHVVPSGR